MTGKWNIVNGQSNASYDIGNDAYIIVKGDITVTASPATQVSFKKLCTIY